MIIRGTDGTGNWNFGKGLASYMRDEQAIEQSIRSRVLSWVGDCFFATQDGVDWKNRIGIGQGSDLEKELRTIILGSFGVVGVTNVTLQFDNVTRNYKIQYELTTIFSPSFVRTIEQGYGLAA
jgi:hypothetical protein